MAEQNKAIVLADQIAGYVSDHQLADPTVAITARDDGVGLEADGFLQKLNNMASTRRAISTAQCNRSCAHSLA